MVTEEIAKAPADMGVSAGAGREDQITECIPNDSSASDHTMTPDQKQGIVSQYLSEGHKNAVPCRELVKLCGCRSARELRSAIENERKQGSLILSSNEGYFLPSRDDSGEIAEEGYREMKSYYHRMRGIAIGTLSSSKLIYRAIKDYEQGVDHGD